MTHDLSSKPRMLSIPGLRPASAGDDILLLDSFLRAQLGLDCAGSPQKQPVPRVRLG